MSTQSMIRNCIVAMTALLVASLSQAAVTLNSTNFPDANFRAALISITGVNEGGTLNETTLTRLDVSDKGITNLKGLELLTALTYLDISDNSTLTTGANLTNLTSLQTLKASNCNISTLAGTSGNTNHPGSGLTIGTGNANIVYLDLSDNANFYYSGNLQYLTQMETLLLNGCTNYDYWSVTPGAAMRSLKWLDISNTKCDRIYLPNATQLTHLNAAATLLKGFSSSAGYSSQTPTALYIQVPVGLSTLKYLNLADCPNLTDFRAINAHYQISSLDTLILTNDTNLGWSNSGIEPQSGMTYLDVTNCNITTAGPNYIPDFSYLTALETLLYGENPDVTYLQLTGNSNIKTLDLHGDTGLTSLSLDNCGLPRNSLSINGTNCPALASLNLNNNGYGSVSEAMGDATAWSLDNVKFLYLANNSGFVGGPLTLGEGDCAGLHGLDLGNNGFTSFLAESLPASLTALMLGNNTAMTRLEMHHNPGINTMTANPTMSEGSGLYLLGNSALTYMDISGTADQPNYFQRIGNNSSLNGVPIDTLRASYNKFYTFRNLTPVAGDNYERWRKSDGVYDNIVSNTPPSLQYYYYAYWPSSPAQTDSASLEQLTGLKYLDLSHCQLKDSLYLHKNTELRYLDVSHNRTIKRYTTSQDKGKAYRESIPANNTFNRNFEDYKKYLWLVDLTPKYPGRQEAYDQEYYTMDYNDTTGLYILDLMDNDKLEYLDVSYTGIQQTALTHCHVSNARFMWIQDLHNLKYLYADYNGMRSMGIGTANGKRYQEGLKSLERLSVIGMRGADVTTMQGSMNFQPESRCKKLHYINLSYSDFDSIGFYAPQIDTIIIKGNPIHHVNVQTVDAIKHIDATECAFKQRGYDPETGITVGIPSTVRQRYNYTDYSTGVTQTLEKTITMNGARIGGVYTGALTTPWSGLRSIRAHNRPELMTVLLDNSNALTEVFCHHDPKLPEISGFDNLPYSKSIDSQFGFPVDADSLRLVYVNDNAVFNKLDLSHNNNLNYLHAYNDKALGDALGDLGMRLNNNPNLISAWVSNSNLQHFTNNATTNLDTLKIWQNPQLSALNVTANTGLKWLDLRNCMVRTLDVNSNSQLTYFDCSNMDSISAGWSAFDNYGFEMPRQVPTSMSEPGKNSIADLHFGSKALQVVRADNNDLYCMDGLNDNPDLETLTYSYNHINGIDLSGCPSITTYDCYHNVRGLIMGELATWLEKSPTGDTNTCSMYYLQLKENAGDALQQGYDTFLGHKCGQDSIESPNDPPYMRQLRDDGFDPDKVISFTVNSSGPYSASSGDDNGNGSGNAPRRADIIYGPDTIPDASKIIGTVAIIRMYDLERNYIEYLYDDGRPGNNRDGGGSAFGIAWAPPGTPTDVEEVIADDLGELTVVSERYYDSSGVEHPEPISGMNIIVRQMSDGTTQTVKVMR